MATPAPRPRIRLDKKEAKKGDLVEVKALVAAHNGVRSAQGQNCNVIPRKIIPKFTCEVNGKLVFSCDLEPAYIGEPVHAVQVPRRGIRQSGADMDRR